MEKGEERASHDFRGHVCFFDEWGIQVTLKGWIFISDDETAYVNGKGYITKIKSQGKLIKPETDDPEETIEEEEKAEEEEEEEEEDTEDTMTMSDGTVLDLTYFPETLTEVDESQLRGLSEPYWELRTPCISSNRDVNASFLRLYSMMEMRNWCGI